jgi:hypothetical protein
MFLQVSHIPEENGFKARSDYFAGLLLYWKQWLIISCSKRVRLKDTFVKI